MSKKEIFGYMGKILRVDLSGEKSRIQEIDEDTCEKYVGGVAMGAHFLCEEIPAGVKWSSPENRLIFMTGPLAGTRVSGSGTFCALTKGPMTNMASSTQANGFLGAFLRFSGYDGLVIQGQSSNPTYLYIHEKGVEFKDANHLMGKGTLETQEEIKKELNLGRKLSVFAIGPAGENLVRFSGIVGDGGHVAAHNGIGAVMGSKKLKAIAVHHGSCKPPIKDPDQLVNSAKELLKHAKNFDNGRLFKWGTNGTFAPQSKTGEVPVKNYTTNIVTEHEKLLPEYTRSHFEIKPKPCWACGLAHVKHVKVTEGPYKGLEGEEPEYECVNAWGPLTGNSEPGAVVMLSNLTDDLGMDVNESGYMFAWLMECNEKGLLTKKDTDGLDLTWGNVEQVGQMLQKIARREGFGDTLAQGVKRASEQIGGEAAKLAIFTHKGNTPRSHDHRARWNELVDTCLSDTGTCESSFGPMRPELLGKPPVENKFSTEEIPEILAFEGGWRQFEDCLGVCKFCIKSPELTLECLKDITGWQMDIQDAMSIGKRAINQLRVFNIRHGLKSELERPSLRYGSVPSDGPVKGKGIMTVWDVIVKSYYTHMGWDPKTGKPLPETLSFCDLDHLIPDL